MTALSLFGFTAESRSRGGKDAPAMPFRCSPLRLRVSAVILLFGVLAMLCGCAGVSGGLAYQRAGLRGAVRSDGQSLAVSGTLGDGKESVSADVLFPLPKKAGLAK